MKKRGFTIVESLVAISILVLIILSTSRTIQMGISSYIFSKDQIIAFYLAQEAFEQIRNLRDQNGLDQSITNWLTGISAQSTDPCYFNNPCWVDTAQSTGQGVGPFRCSGSCPQIYEHPDLGIYGYNTATPWIQSPFTRTITLTQVNSNEITVQVTVTWRKGATNRSFTAKENLFNWQ